MNEIKNYINNIIKLINTEFANIAEKCGVLVRKGATVASYDSATKKATVYFDGDSTTESAPYYNKSGHTLEIGQRVYIFHLFGNPSQGWIMMRAGAYPDDESGSGGGLDGIVIDGSGNAMTNASLSDNILTLTKGTTFATQSDLTTHTGNSNIHVTSADKTRWDSKSDFSGSYNDLTDVPSSFPPSSHSHGNITNDGGINTTTQIASGDRLIISDTSSGDLNASSITFGGSTTQYLANNGTWQTPDIPDATTTTPKMDGTAAVGTETAWAKGDHVHPTDTSRAAASDLSAHTSDAAIHITATERDNWDAAYTDAHIHTNKALLDTYDQTNANIKDAVTKRHTHSNKTVLDGITSTDITGWDNAAADSHTHANKALLDTYTQTEANLADAVSKKHTHSNKSVLDGISATDVSNWDAKQDALTEGTDYLNKTHLDENYASLDSSGKVPQSQLPSYVDDVLEYSGRSAFPTTGETGKIYVDTSTNLTYRWSGTTYVEISPSLALGETSSTAYRGDRGKIAYDHSQDGTVHVTSTQKTNWNTAYTNTHTHSNKTVIDSITASDIDSWNSKSEFSGDYEDLENKPQVNNVTLIGNKTLDQLNIQVKGDYADSALTNMEIEALLSAN